MKGKENLKKVPNEKTVIIVVLNPDGKSMGMVPIADRCDHWKAFQMALFLTPPPPTETDSWGNEMSSGPDVPISKTEFSM